MKQILIKHSYFFTLIFFSLGFFNIFFGWLGFFCLILPFIFIAKDKKNSWCQSYCPRANLLSTVLKPFSKVNRVIPQWLLSGKGKSIMMVYFSLNMFMILMSTLMVFMDRREPLDKIRLLIAFQLPWDIPQLLHFPGLSDWIIHLSFRMYSMMLTTTIIGLVLGTLYRPRTWCTICPMATLTSMTLKDASQATTSTEKYIA